MSTKHDEKLLLSIKLAIEKYEESKVEFPMWPYEQQNAYINKYDQWWDQFMTFSVKQMEAITEAAEAKIAAAEAAKAATKLIREEGESMLANKKLKSVAAWESQVTKTVGNIMVELNEAVEAAAAVDAADAAEKLAQEASEKANVATKKAYEKVAAVVAAEAAYNEVEDKEYAITEAAAAARMLAKISVEALAAANEALAAAKEAAEAEIKAKEALVSSPAKEAALAERIMEAYEKGENNDLSQSKAYKIRSEVARRS